ncbi:hypothetical protein [Siphonobacter sp. SORGH_AS_1065]|uniref:hypothetical protein n=1 Tax=Siphonobacter sp. SORGH_AS_1065 TaxID=3041795 RepID=UPI002784F559|nr:hypothetical protein [Siphonobacter sp. SORGH_AS_1065]MDQ1088431.1 hypothetical protein [Siphonobacter sp. SORGH_AS_1065]
MHTTSKFWEWFKDNNKAYTFLNFVDEEAKEKLLNDFLEQLHKYCDKIYFEIGGYPDEDQELIITAEGDKDYFHQVEELVNAAPKIDGWTFIAFKPPMPDNFKSKWDDLELNTEDMWFLPLSNDKTQDLGIRVCFNNQDLIKGNKTLTPLLYKMLDTIAGEKSFALDIHYIDTDLLPDYPNEEGMYPILELPNYIEWHKSQATKSST